MTDLSPRQQQLLKSVIELYVKNGEPVSSEQIEKSYDLGVSPATIRNEMVRLTDAGFLRQPHTSAGRVPTAIGFRLYIAELMKTREMPVMDEVTIRQQVLNKKEKFYLMVEEATRALAKKSGTLALSISDGQVYYTGASYILDFSEFNDIDVCRFVLSLFDNYTILNQIIGTAQGAEPLHIIFGEETEYEFLQPTSFAFLDYGSSLNEQGIIGIIGPARLNFPVVIPYLRYIGDLLIEAKRAW